MAATRAPIWKDQKQDHEQDGFAPTPHTACVEINRILSSLALLCLLDAFLELIDQNVATQRSVKFDMVLVTTRCNNLV